MLLVWTEKIVRHVEATFDMLLRHVAGVDGALEALAIMRYINLRFTLHYNQTHDNQEKICKKYKNLKINLNQHV